MSLFFAINSTGGYRSESGAFEIQIQPDRSVWLNRVDPQTGKMLSRSVAKDLQHAADAVTIYEHGYRTVNMDGAQPHG